MRRRLSGRRCIFVSGLHDLIEVFFQKLVKVLDADHLDVNQKIVRMPNQYSGMLHVLTGQRFVPVKSSQFRKIT